MEIEKTNKKVFVVLTIFADGGIAPPMVFNTEEARDYFVKVTIAMFPPAAVDIKKFETDIQNLEEVKWQEQNFIKLIQMMSQDNNKTQA